MHIPTLLTIASLIPVFASVTSAAPDLYHRYMSQALQGSLAQITNEVLNPDSTLTKKEQNLVKNFSERFGPNGHVEEPTTDQPLVRDVVFAYRAYWAEMFMQEYSMDKKEEMIIDRVTKVLADHGIPLVDSLTPLEQVSEEFEKLGYEALTGRTLPHFDLLSWGENEGVDYQIGLTDDSVTVKIYFMSDFVSYGWSHYATFGRAYPGGWATSEALYCMAEDYDRSSEKFLISYLQHEGRHFADYQIFPKLEQADLEYRAKLTELVYAESTLQSLIESFITSSARNAAAPHSLANHELISQLSRVVFNEEFTSDRTRWQSIDAEQIHEAASTLLEQSTRDLTLAGADTVTGLILP